MDMGEPTPTADMPPLTWGGFAKECSIRFAAVEQMAHYALHCEDLEGRIRIAARLNELCGEFRQVARDIESEVSAEVAKAGGSVAVDGLGEVVAHLSAQKVSWDKPALLSAIVARAIDERDCVCDAEGELLPYPVVAQNMADRILECVAVDYGRVKACKAHGVDATRYREFSGERRRTLQFPRVER